MQVPRAVLLINLQYSISLYWKWNFEYANVSIYRTLNTKIHFVQCLHFYHIHHCFRLRILICIIQFLDAVNTKTRSSVTVLVVSPHCCFLMCHHMRGKLRNSKKRNRAWYFHGKNRQVVSSRFSPRSSICGRRTGPKQSKTTTTAHNSPASSWLQH